MKEEVKDLLRTLSDWELRELQTAMTYAGRFRQVGDELRVNVAEFAGLPAEQESDLRCGAHAYGVDAQAGLEDGINELKLQQLHAQQDAQRRAQTGLALPPSTQGAPAPAPGGGKHVRFPGGGKHGGN